MTDQPDKLPDDAELPAEPAEPTAADPAPAPVDVGAVPQGPTPTRWDGVRPRGRLGQIATILVATASAVFIAGAIFVAGVAVGSEGGDEHHGHDGDAYSQSEGDDHGGEAAESSSDGRAGEEPGDENSNGGEEP